ncbi:amino acid or gaba permease [Coniochaeta sp. PMI_546]|nr:amino acid or gaba permease [Coniochaeta sp. PMI_546]
MAEKVNIDDSIDVAPRVEAGEVLQLSEDEQHLANLGYKQEFFRHLGLFENWAATFTSMNFISGIPVLFGWICYTGGPKAGFANWSMVGGFSVLVSLASIVPGVQQGSTNFLLAALEIKYPDSEILYQGWFSWLLTAIGMLFAMAPNIISQRASGHFQTRAGVFDRFYNGINLGDEMQASDSYCWIIGILFGAWVFFGYDASAHLAEETHEASDVVAKGMWMATLSSWLLSMPTLIIILFCIQDFDGIIAATYSNNWAEYLVQLIGPNGAVAVLAILWVDSTCATASCFMSAQRVTFAISRDGVLPFSRYFRRLSKNKIPVNAAYLVCALSIIITLAVIGSNVAFSAITATAAIATNFSYLIPITARYTVGRKNFKPAKWNLGRYSPILGTIAILYIMLLFSVLLLPQLYPVTKETLNYAPVCIGIVTIVSLVGWVLPFGLGGRHWFTGPKRTIEEIDHGETPM